MCLSLFKLFQKVLSLSLSLIGQGSKQNFFIFPQISSRVFWLLRLVGPFCLSFFIYFHVSCIFFMHFWEIFEPKENWGFCCSFVFNLIKLLIWEKLNFSRAWNYPNWGFCSIEHNLMKLACWMINLIIIICSLSCVNWYLSVCWNLWKWVFKFYIYIYIYIYTYIYIYIYINSMLKSILWF